MEKEQTVKKKNVKTKKTNKTRKIKIIGVVAILLIITIVVILCVALNKEQPNDNGVEYSQFNHIDSAIESYNKSKENTVDQVILVDPEEEADDDILFIINGKLDSEDTNHTSTVNYTERRVNTIVYDEKGNLKEIVNAIIDKNYNITQIAVLSSNSTELVIYTAEDEKYEEYKKKVNVAVERMKEVMTSLNANNINLFGKTLTDLKNTEYSK